MRNLLALFCSSLVLVACGGGSGGAGESSCDTCSTGTSIPYGSVSGTSFDGLIIGGTVRVYDFTTGSKGALLGSAQTNGLGLYSLSLQVESRPVLIEVTGGYYVEEAGTNPANISLSTNHKLTAVANYGTGSSLAVAVTTASHLAAGLAAYQIRAGSSVSAAINSANTRVSNLVGVDILTTTPKEITDSGNASATLTPPLRYGFLAGAISDWTYNHAPAAAIPHQPPYTSIDFAQLLYSDIAADGLLDGVGPGGTPLSFGTTPLGVGVYRLGLGTSIVRIAANANNKTGLTPLQVRSFAESYISNTDAFFNAVPVVSFVPPVVSGVSPASNIWARRAVNVSASVSSPFGLQSAELLVDGTPVATSPNLTAPSFSYNTTGLADGPHTLAIRSTDVGGYVTTANIDVKVDNTAPTSTGALDAVGNVMTHFGIASDNYSGVVSAQNIIDPGFTNASTQLITTVDPVTGAWALGQYNFFGLASVIRLSDAAGNCNDYYYSNRVAAAAPIWGWAIQTPDACP